MESAERLFLDINTVLSLHFHRNAEMKGIQRYLGCSQLIVSPFERGGKTQYRV